MSSASCCCCSEPEYPLYPRIEYVEQAGTLLGPTARVPSASTYEGGGSPCAMYYPFDLADPGWLVSGFYFTTTKVPSFSGSADIFAGLVEDTGYKSPSTTNIFAGQKFSLTDANVVVADPAMANEGASPRAIFCEFAEPVSFIGYPRRIFLCVCYPPTWVTTTGTNEALVSRPVVGASQFKMALASFSESLPLVVSSAMVVNQPHFLSFIPKLHVALNY